MQQHLALLLLCVQVVSLASCATPVAVEPPDYSSRLSQSDIAQLKQLVAQMPRLPQSVYRIDAERSDRAVVHTGRWHDLGDISFWFTAEKKHGKWRRISEEEYRPLEA